MNKDTSDEAKRSREEIFNFELARVMNGEGLSKDEYLQKFSYGVLTKAEYDQLIAEIDKREKAAAKVQDDALKDRAFQNANNIFQQFGLDNLNDAYNTIRAITDRDERQQTWDFFNQRLAAERSSRNENNRIIAERRKQNYIDLDNNYWRNFKPVPREVLDNLRDNQGLNDEQLREL